MGVSGGTYHFRPDDLYTRNSLEKKEKSDVLVKNIYKNIRKRMVRIFS